LYVAAVESFAKLVQQLPASEAHHHAGKGGLLDHSLEVAVIALQLRRGYLLPPGVAPEDQARLQDLWTYAVFTAALVHDLGKPVVDQRVQLFDDRGQSAGIWDPWQGSIPEPLGSYRVSFVRERRHKLHERVVPLLASRVIPPVGLSWIAGNREAFSAWLAAVSGAIEEAEPLGEILLQADQQSVARNLTGAATVPRVATVQAKPLAERLLTGFRYLLDHGTLPLNRPGAAGFCVGEDLWLVSKRALDALREHLLAEGQPGIPARNERLMDELQQHGLLIPNGDRAVWTAEVRLGEWCQRLTLLRFAVARLWPDLQGRPRPAAGSVLPLTGEGHSPSADPLPRAAQVTPKDGITDEEENPTGVQPPASGGETGGVGLDRPRREEKEPTSAEEPLAPDDEDDPGERFLRWLREGIEGRTLEINTPNARLHVLPEGLALVSPGVFRDFDPTQWQHVQKRFQRLKHHRKRADGTNIWRCLVAKDRKQSFIKVFLLPLPEAILGISLPPPNPAVSLLLDE
jgi:integrating conjugative element relaxase (TIGR03760 family)